jgi:GNAT superfamily N-acetyltransferase
MGHQARHILRLGSRFKMHQSDAGFVTRRLNSQHQQFFHHMPESLEYRMAYDIESIEHATLDAVAPLTIETIAGWLLPFDTTSIGRAISAVPLRHDDVDPESVVEIESRYAQHGYRAQFRVAEVEGLGSLRWFLRERGYVPHQPTLTLVGSARDWPRADTDWAVRIAQQATEEWMSVYLSDDFDPLDGANRVTAMRRSHCLVYGHICDESGPVAAGTASFSQGWIGLHGLRTVKRVRNRGCGRTLIAALGELAIAKEYERCFLQVSESNFPAVSLYGKLGFQTAWRYHYWRKST